MLFASKQIDEFPVDADPADALRYRAKGTNVNGDTLLATDYLNHFNEVVMLIDLLPSMPDVAEDITAWRPKDYVTHFRDSGLRDGEFAVEAYAHALESARLGLEETVEEINKVILSGADELRLNLELDDPIGIELLSTDLSRYLRHLIDVAAGHINGTMPAADSEHLVTDDDTEIDETQAAIDALME